MKLLKVAILLSALTAPLLHAEKLRKVIILDFKNLDKNPDYGYLEDSITEAIRNDLKAKFDFKELPQKDWRNLAEKNYFLWPEENHSRGFALNLGLLARQDIAIGGYYQAIIEKKSRRGAYVIRAHVFVLDIGKKTVVSELDMVMPADASLFGAVEELAARVVKESKSVLPNKGETGKQQFDDDEIGPHELGVFAGISPVSVPDAFSGTFSSDKKLFNKDIAQTIGVYGSYRYHDLFWPRLAFDIAAGAQFGSTDLTVANDTKKAKASVTDYSLAAHLGYRIEIWRFSFMPLAGGGFSLASLKLDYSTLSSLPIDASGNPLSSNDINTSAPFGEGGLKLGFRITQHLHLNVQGIYRQHFYIGSSAGQIIATGGLTFRL